MSEQYNGCGIKFTGNRDCSQCAHLMWHEHGAESYYYCSITEEIYFTVKIAEGSLCKEFYLDACDGEYGPPR